MGEMEELRINPEWAPQPESGSVINWDEKLGKEQVLKGRSGVERKQVDWLRGSNQSMDLIILGSHELRNGFKAWVPSPRKWVWTVGHPGSWGVRHTFFFFQCNTCRVFTLGQTYSFQVQRIFHYKSRFAHLFLNLRRTCVCQSDLLKRNRHRWVSLGTAFEIFTDLLCKVTNLRFILLDELILLLHYQRPGTRKF